MFPWKTKEHYLFYLDDEITKQREEYSGLSDEEKEQVENSILGDKDEGENTESGQGKYQQQNNVSFSY